MNAAKKRTGKQEKSIQKLAACSLNGVMYFVLKLLYNLAPEPLNGMMYLVFLGLCVTFAVGAEWKRLPSYLGCIVVGVVWFYGYCEFDALTNGFLFSDAVNSAIGFGFMSFVIEIFNICLLSGTPLGFSPMQFASVIGIFSQGGENIPYVLVSLVVGMMAAMLSKTIYSTILR
ncbi:MAG: DUF1097 family protein [Bacteroides thetaiotaomicron]|nr:DUF1097 family protein [Bacteroides thetaiotaomicron]